MIGSPDHPQLGADGMTDLTGDEVKGSTSPLILLGNNEGQEVSGCTIKDPR